MKSVRQVLRPVGLFLAVFMLMISGPIQSASAALVGTESMLDAAQGRQARDYLKSLLAREDVQAALAARGLDPIYAGFARREGSRAVCLVFRG